MSPPSCREVFENFFPKNEEADQSLIYEYIIHVLRELSADFGSDYENRELIIVSDLIIHVRDISHEDFYSQNTDVKNILSSIFYDSKTKIPKVIEVINKIDKSQYVNQSNILNTDSCKTNKVFISAKSGEGIVDLRNQIDNIIRQKQMVSRHYS